MPDGVPFRVLLSGLGRLRDIVNIISLIGGNRIFVTPLTRNARANTHENIFMAFGS